jgi:hypothetical protein
MIGDDVAKLFEAQLARRTGAKVILAPSPLKEPGPHITVKVRKVIAPKMPRGAMRAHELRLYVSVEGKVESETGRKMAIDTCEAASTYLAEVSHLEDEGGNPIPNTRVIATINEDDGILGDPDDDKVAWIDDLHYVTIAYPA